MSNKDISKESTYDESIKYFKTLTKENDDLTYKLYDDIKRYYLDKLHEDSLNIKFERIKLQQEEENLRNYYKETMVKYMLIFLCEFTMAIISTFIALIGPNIGVGALIFIIFTSFIVYFNSTDNKPTSISKLPLKIALMVLDELEVENNQ